MAAAPKPKQLASENYEAFRQRLMTICANVVDPTENGSPMVKSVVESCVLYFTDPAKNSDKIYEATIERAGNAYVVNFAYGARGKKMTTGTKTDNPVALGTARMLYEDLVREKQKKGYTTNPTGGIR